MGNQIRGFGFYSKRYFFAFVTKMGEKLRESCKEAFIFTNNWTTTTPERTEFNVRPYLKFESGEKGQYSPNALKFENANVFSTILSLYKRNFFMEIQIMVEGLKDFDCY